MASDRAPWHPAPQWADPLIGLLATFSLLVAAAVMGARSPAPAGAANVLQEGLRRLPLPAQAAAGLVLTLLLLGGLAFAFFLLATRTAPRPPAPAWGMSGRAVALVFLGWFLVYLVVNAAMAFSLRGHAQWRLPALPLSYALHAAAGLWMVARAEGLSLRELLRRVLPGAALPQLLLAPAFLALGFLLAFTASVALAPLLRHAPGSQAQLVELLRTARSPGLGLLVLLTVSVLAPVFEETLIRGFLLPWMGPRWGWGRALAASSLLFAFIHLQLAALPALAALGLGLGLALWRTGSLRTSIAVHSLWNGAVFGLVRLLG
ncbi:MAG TPA: type II CAAX endopeptidase family protein [Holophagaceae bacterium]|nr:type II CAAX endopeptidase family protein [Holophagaceae bacterium]